MEIFQYQKPVWVPHEYQIEGIRLALGQAALGLFLDPGLGKTSTVLSAFKILKDQGLARKLLVIAPLRPCYAVWPTEIEKWDNFKDLTYTIVHGADKEACLRADADIYIVNPEGLVWLYDERYKRNDTHRFDILCVDESTKFKDSTTRRFKALRPHLPNFKRRWILTGTPSPNGIGDLFGQVYILDGGRALGKYKTHFQNTFFYRAGFNMYDWRPRPGAFEEIVNRIKPLIYQLNAEDYLKMPEQIVTDVTVQLPDAAMSIYKSIEDDFIVHLEDDTLVADNAAVAGIKCRQVANGAVYMGEAWKEVHNAKIEALKDLVDELGGKPLLVLYEFRHDQERLAAAFPDSTTLGSGTAPKTLEAIVSRFNRGEIPILFGHPASMGHGLNLQGSCHHVIWFGIPWNLEHYDQTIARVYRQGQKADHVFIYHLIAKGTLDEKVSKVLKDKDKVQQTLLDALHR
jgi:SNF2 family DNA or RNA helicase